MYFLNPYVAKAGTGTLDMIKLCREAGLPRPEFRQDSGIFVQVLRRPPSEVAGEVAGEVAALIKIFQGSLMTRSALQAALKLKGADNFRQCYLIPALKAGMIAMTLPDKPNSRLQKYVLSKKGCAWLASNRLKQSKP